MPTPLEALGPALNSVAGERLGDTFTYTPAGGVAASVVAFVDFEEIDTAGGPGAIAQSVLVEAFFDQIPVRPDGSCRVQDVPRYPGETFKPVDVRLNESGDGWLFNLKKP